MQIALPGNTQQIDIHVPGGPRTLNSSKRTAIDTRLRPLSHWVQPVYKVEVYKHTLRIKIFVTELVEDRGDSADGITAIIID